MCSYVFLDESELPPPRAVRRQVAQAAKEVSSQLNEVMEVVVEALTAFPDAYRAVVRLLKERRAQRLAGSQSVQEDIGQPEFLSGGTSSFQPVVKEAQRLEEFD